MTDMSDMTLFPTNPSRHAHSNVKTMGSYSKCVIARHATWVRSKAQAEWQKWQEAAKGAVFQPSPFLPSRAHEWQAANDRGQAACLRALAFERFPSNAHLWPMTKAGSLAEGSQRTRHPMTINGFAAVYLQSHFLRTIR
jgi:hypothetical protein